MSPQDEPTKVALPPFSTLLASGPARSSREVRASALSMLTHAVVIGAVVYSTMGGAEEVDATLETVFEMTTVPEFAPPPPPPVVRAELRERSFESVVVPATIPDFIPPPSPTPFRAIPDFLPSEPAPPGAQGGAGTTVTVDSSSTGPRFTPYTVSPQLRNQDDVVRALEREYPPLLREAGIGGKVVVWCYVDVDGKVERTQISETSGHEALDEAALEVAILMRFSPALNRDTKVPVWISLPITFRTR